MKRLDQVRERVLHVAALDGIEGSETLVWTVAHDACDLLAEVDRLVGHLDHGTGAIWDENVNLHDRVEAAEDEVEQLRDELVEAQTTIRQMRETVA